MTQLCQIKSQKVKQITDLNVYHVKILNSYSFPNSYTDDISYTVYVFTAALCLLYAFSYSYIDTANVTNESNIKLLLLYGSREVNSGPFSCGATLYTPLCVCLMSVPRFVFPQDMHLSLQLQLEFFFFLSLIFSLQLCYLCLNILSFLLQRFKLDLYKGTNFRSWFEIGQILTTFLALDR